MKKELSGQHFDNEECFFSEMQNLPSMPIHFLGEYTELLLAMC